VTNAYEIINGKPGRKRQVERPKHRWEDDIEMALREIG
jgi:hypothetical protein